MSKLRNLGQAVGGGRGPWERRLLLWVGIVLVVAVLAVTGAYHFDQFTEGDVFCGKLCHPNRPEYVAHEVSPHANVECGHCHIGPGLWPKVEAKIFGVGELVSMVTNSYERPIALPVERMRPAEDVCGQCHWPEMFDADRVHGVSTFAQDEANSEALTYLVLRIGGGGDEDGEALGIHWHASSPVWYVARDEERQDIPWVGVMDGSGEMVEYQAKEGSLTAEEVESHPRLQMDCMTCHNRATHKFRKPESLVDEALAAGRMDSGLPYLKREAMELLSTTYPTQEAGLEAMEDLPEFYRSEYPAVYTAQQQAVEQAVDTLQEIYGQTTFPAMNLTWDSYPDNVGHRDSPGCFRCHDGEHVNAQGEVIPASCSLCHSVPVVITPDEEPEPSMLTDFFALAGQEPDSHRQETFVWDHRIMADVSCADCHGPIEYGDDNSSFCANGACHGQTWVGLDVEVDFEHPVQLTGRHAQALCYECHQGVERPSLEDCATCHRPEPEPHFGSECTQCHTTDGWKESAASWVMNPPDNPHGLSSIDCALCHAEGGARPAPTTHRDIPSQSCVYCHETVTTARVPTIPHLVAEPDTCLTCHGEGVLKPTSATHQGIPAASCVYCHESGPIADVPTIPHLVAEPDTCLTCHGEGAMKPESAMHEGIPSASCVYCHESVPVAGVPIIPHAVEGSGPCLACHDEGRLEPVPASHTGWVSESCLLCHEAS